MDSQGQSPEYYKDLCYSKLENAKSLEDVFWATFHLNRAITNNWETHERAEIYNPFIIEFEKKIKEITKEQQTEAQKNTQRIQEEIRKLIDTVDPQESKNFRASIIEYMEQEQKEFKNKMEIKIKDMFDECRKRLNEKNRESLDG